MAKIPEVLVVDQDPAARFEIKQLVKRGPFIVAAEAGFGTEAASAAAEAKPDVIICGMSASPERSLQTIEALLDVMPETPLIAYGWHAELDTVRQAMLAGARDFLVMPGDAERIKDSILSVLGYEERKRMRQSGQAQAMGPRGLVITVFGAKGGVGKTTLATNLGVAMSGEMGQSVVLLDADTGFGDVAATLDIQSEHSIVELAEVVDRVERDALSDYLASHESGLSVLPAPRESLLWRSLGPETFRKVLSLLAKQFDVVIVDTAGTLNEVSIAALEEANLVLWVTSSDFTSINGSLQGLETLRRLSFPEERIRLMLNVVSSDEAIAPGKIEQALGWQFFWLVPYDRQIRLSGQMGRPIVTTQASSPAARSILQLAHTLMGNGARPRHRPSLLKRILDRRSGRLQQVTPSERRS